MSNYIEDSERIIIVPVSFETGEQTDTFINFSRSVQILACNAYVSKALAGTNAGTITLKDASANTISTITIPLSSAINTDVDGAISATYYKTGASLEIISQKTTAGGKALLQITYRLISLAGAL